MKTEFDKLYQTLERALHEIVKISAGINLSKQSIVFIKKVVLEIKLHRGDIFKTKEDENEFFRHVWELEKVLFSDNDSSLSDYTWDPTDADYVEWLYFLHSVKAIKYKGEPADISRLQKWGKLSLNREVSNIYDRFKVIRNRKKDRMAFTKRGTNALERRMDEADGKYE